MLAAALLTENARYNLWQQAQTTLTMLAILLVALLCMLLATRLHRIVGNGGASIISRVMGMILAALATTSVLEGTRDFFAL